MHHDLVKRALWAARDLRQAGAKPGSQDWPLLRRALYDLCDEDGRPCDAQTLWAHFLSQVPPTFDRQRLLRVTAAVQKAQTIATPPSCPGENSPEELIEALLELGVAIAELTSHALATRTP